MMIVKIPYPNPMTSGFGKLIDINYVSGLFQFIWHIRHFTTYFSYTSRKRLTHSNLHLDTFEDNVVSRYDISNCWQCYGLLRTVGELWICIWVLAMMYIGLFYPLR